MNKISVVAAGILVALVFSAVSYFFLLVVSFDEWEIPWLNHLFGWLWTTRSGQGVCVTLFVLALWPHGERGERPRNIPRKSIMEPNREETTTRTK